MLAKNTLKYWYHVGIGRVAQAKTAILQDFIILLKTLLKPKKHICFMPMILHKIKLGHITLP